MTRPVGPTWPLPAVSVPGSRSWAVLLPAVAFLTFLGLVLIHRLDLAAAGRSGDERRH